MDFDTRSAFGKIRPLGLGLTYIHLGFYTTTTRDEDDFWVEHEVETVVRGVFRNSTAEERFDTWTDAFSSPWELDN